MAIIGNISTINVNGNELTIKDAALTEIVNEIIDAIGANNTNIAERINDLHNRSFDNTIKISSQNESEIANIQDGLYKIQYVTVTGEGDGATETLNNSAILIQKVTNQYLYKDGIISSRTKTDSTWGNWITFEGGVTSVNGMTGAVTVKENVQADWDATTGDAVILNKPNIENVDIADAFGTKINGLGGEFISLTGGITISNSNYNSANIKLGYHGGSDDDTITLTSRGSDGGIHVITDNPFTYNNKEVATVDQIITPPVTSVNGQTGAVTITETQLSKGNATGTGNAVTDINVSNHQITLVKGATYATQSDIDTSIANLVDSAPETLNTLNELAEALGNDENFATTVATQIGEKYTKPVTGIPESDLSQTVQDKLNSAGVTSFNGATGAVTYTAPVSSVNGQTGAVSLALGDTNVIETVKVNNTELTPVNKVVNITVPTKVSDLTNDSGFTSNAGTITSIIMNGVTKGTSGAVDLGTVLTSHQDISGKVDKVTGMGLSTNDYTTAEKNKLAGINIGSLDSLTTSELNSIFS